MEPSPSVELLIAAHRVARLVEDGLREAGASPGEAVLLMSLAERPLTMGGIMRTLHVGGSTATSLVSRLERSGLVAKGRNPEDARSYLVEATPAGLAVAGVARGVYEALDDELMAAGPGVVAAHQVFMRQLADLSVARGDGR